MPAAVRGVTSLSERSDESQPAVRLLPRRGEAGKGCSHRPPGHVSNQDELGRAALPVRGTLLRVHAPGAHPMTAAGATLPKQVRNVILARERERMSSNTTLADFRVYNCRHRVFHLPFARGIATSRAQSMKSCAAGPSVRFRSEERRVGKECRYRWARYHCNK